MYMNETDHHNQITCDNLRTAKFMSTLANIARDGFIVLMLPHFFSLYGCERTVSRLT